MEYTARRGGDDRCESRIETIYATTMLALHPIPKSLAIESLARLQRRDFPVE
jgi:hypothetical protein